MFLQYNNMHFSKSENAWVYFPDILTWKSKSTIKYELKPKDAHDTVGHKQK